MRQHVRNLTSASESRISPALIWEVKEGKSIDVDFVIDVLVAFAGKKAQR